eukprot:5001627-Prymnesium_polylepis.1
MLSVRTADRQSDRQCDARLEACSRDVRTVTDHCARYGMSGRCKRFASGSPMHGACAGAKQPRGSLLERLCADLKGTKKTV